MLYYVHRMKNKEEKENMINGLKLTHLATDIRTEIPLNAKEMQLYFAGSNYGWDTACDSVLDRTGIQIQGNYEIDEIVINGISKDFH